MANFPTHIAIGTVVSGGLATVTLAADVVGPENLVAVTLAGVLGSVLPDIDLKDSRPSRAMFAGLGVFFAFAVLFSLETPYSVAEMMLLWLGTLVAVKYVAQAFFHRLSYHRGIWHSVLAALFCACFTAVVYSRLLGRPEGVAWLAALFMFVGYMTHLILDEVYSVDVMDTRIKASFGTALKLFDGNHPGHSSAMAVATVLVFLLSPPIKTFLNGITSPALWSGLQHRLLPHDKWFGVDWRSTEWLPDVPFRPKGAVVPAATSPISTGSITPAPPAEPKPAEQPAEQKAKD
ncbi:MAG TPA: metal-dependent hydrolase [Hyphomicrobiaceae bacterium]|nr:metal-dependent hydrolase [Hyphomicrobiaceae bacterium]